MAAGIAGSVSAVGVDLGTTNTCVALFKNQHVEIICDESGRQLIPSYVTFADAKIPLVGLTALDESHMYPDTSIYDVKRIIGLSGDNKNAKEDIKRFAYPVIEENGSLKIKIFLENENKEQILDETFFPEEISGFVLQYVYNLVQTRLRKDVIDVVVTVPAYFGAHQREATKDAALMAGFKNVYIINEPTAAAIAYQYENKVKQTRTMLVYDFGGGTFDVSVVRGEGSFIKVIATDGDCHLGGTDIDFEVARYVREHIEKKHNVTIADSKNLKRLKDLSKEAKEYLSRNKVFQRTIVKVHPDILEYTFSMSRSQMENIIADVYERTLVIVERCLSSIKLGKSEIDVVALVGGSTRIPMIKRRLRDYFGSDKISTELNPDYLVAKGAAIYAQNATAEKSEITFEDVLSLSLGTKIQRDRMSVIIARNTPLPCEGFKKYRTTVNNQEIMTVDVYQGERSLAHENNLLGLFTVDLKTIAPKGKVTVEIKYSVNTDGILTVEATECNAENKNVLKINLTKKKLPRKCLKRLEDENNY